MVGPEGFAINVGQSHCWTVVVFTCGLKNSSGNGLYQATYSGQQAKPGRPLHSEKPWQAPAFTSSSLKKVRNAHTPSASEDLDGANDQTHVRLKVPPLTWQYDITPSKMGGEYIEDVRGEACRKLCRKDGLEAAVAALSLLLQSGSRVSTSLFYEVIRGCVEQKNLVLGRRVHALAVKGGYHANAFVANNILRMYAHQGRLDEAMQVFTQVTTPSSYMWFSIISAHVELGKPALGLKLYQQMLLSSVRTNNYVFVAALKACAALGDLRCGRNVHVELLKRGVAPDVFLGTSLVDMYAKCHSLEDALRVFNGLHARNVVTWNCLINGYAEQGFGQDALALYARMEQDYPNLADRSTFSSLLKACASIGALDQGKQLHVQIVERGLSEDMVIGACLVDMYAKCGSLKDARGVFDALPAKNVFVWTTMMAGYAEHGLGQEALALYAQMEKGGGAMADRGTFACLLKACADVGAIQQGKQLHLQILERGWGTDMMLGSSLVDMYAKCGRLEDACRVFDRLPAKDVITWTAMIHGLGQNEKAHEAILCFQDMLYNGVQPNEATFTCLLVACSRGGLVIEGRQCFEAMKDHEIVPTQRHYLCMVDLLGRSGYLVEAEELLLTMPFRRDVVAWTILLNACKSYTDVDCGRRCFQNLVSLDPQNSATYVLMASIYANAGRWTDVYRIDNLRKLAGARKKAAEAGIEVNRQVRTFLVGEEWDAISSKSRTLTVQLKEEGYIPQIESVLMPVARDDKEVQLCGHAEKLALAYGLLHTAHGTPLLVTKNLRMCCDCHTATQIMSRIERREIVVRDGFRVHRFLDGSCSCGERP